LGRTRTARFSHCCMMSQHPSDIGTLHAPFAGTSPSEETTVRANGSGTEHGAAVPVHGLSIGAQRARFGSIFEGLGFLGRADLRSSRRAPHNAQQCDGSSALRVWRKCRRVSRSRRSGMLGRSLRDVVLGHAGRGGDARARTITRRDGDAYPLKSESARRPIAASSSMRMP
jgi:hypothetical protein